MPGFDLTGRVAIVSGGSQGMGRAYCLELAGAGADVAVIARMPEPVTGGRSRPHDPVERVVEEVQALGRRALGVTADVREPDQVTEMVRQVHETLGRIDILVNVAGGSWGETFRSGPLAEIDHNDLVEAFLVNVKTTFLCSSTVAPIMMEQGKGAIINIASSSGVGASPGTGAYGAAKAALISLSQTMAAEWAPKVRVNVILPGGIDSSHRPMWIDAAERPGPGGTSAMRRNATQEEHGGVVLFLASDAGGFMNGAVLDATGSRAPR